ncbi:hypothetical protein [Leisingera sp. JC1]|uniref:hypothetical protein n=1 Tax=Leisingera sp. JC1 TaxID=1855282 RepID=UPI000807B0ED|nr:hypothetical protein [Leisingera sp. JC1]OBY24388.1 hypothetical protein A9D60_24340 [Leisingera sp. JC1]
MQVEPIMFAGRYTYSAFDKDQRVTHAAITENKRLGTVLEFIKAEQEKDTPPKTKPAVKQRTRYKKTGRKPPGRPSKMEGYYARRRAEREAAALLDKA